MSDDLPEKWRRLGFDLLPNAEDKRRFFIEQARSGNTHPEISDHVAEMVADRSAPDASVHALHAPTETVRAGIHRPGDAVPAMACIDPCLEMRPFRTATKKCACRVTQHLLCRIDDDIRERLHLVLEKGECA